MLVVVPGSKDWRFLQEMLRREAGIVLDEEKKYLVETRLAALARAESTCVEDLFARAKRNDVTARRKMIEAMTTNETSFFRDAAIFDAFVKEVVPYLLRNCGAGQIRVWCGAASTGQEPYSLAMALLSRYQADADRFRILATDLDTQALDRARCGEYSQLEVNRGLPASMLVRFFERRGLRWQLKPHVRSMVEFRSMNLARPFPGIGAQHWILLRNVLIYFDAETKADILSRAAEVLAEQGLLVLGGTENMLNSTVPLQPVRFGRCLAYMSAANPRR